VRYAYAGNAGDLGGGVTTCAGCGTAVVRRDWYRILEYRLTDDGRCEACGTPLPGVFDGPAGRWGQRRLPVRLAHVDATAP